MRGFQGSALAAVIILPLLLVSAWTNAHESGEMMYKSLSATGASLQDASVHGWAQLRHGVWTVQELKEIVQLGMAEVGDAKQSYSIEIVRTADQDKVFAVSTGASHQYTISASAMHGSNAYMAVLISGPAEKISVYQRQADKILKAGGGRKHISSCLVGWINGKLNTGDWTTILYRSFAVLKAQVSGEMSDATIDSVIGYSPLLPGGLPINGNKVNVNIASRYSSYDNRTYITLGSPIIAREY